MNDDTADQWTVAKRGLPELLNELERRPERLLGVQPLASLGELAAGPNHETRNLVTMILWLAHLHCGGARE